MHYSIIIKIYVLCDFVEFTKDIQKTRRNIDLFFYPFFKFKYFENNFE